MPGVPTSSHPNNPLGPYLADPGFVLLDGGLGTELERRGEGLSDKLWSARILRERPELIREIHDDFFAAGADLAISASYQATFEGFAAEGIAPAEVEALLRQSVTIARDSREAAAQQRPHLPLVAASVGPYGAYLADGSEYRGDYGVTRRTLVEFHRRRLGVLVDAGADLLALETIPCQAEAEALMTLLPEFPGAWAWLSFSCADATHLASGELLAEAVSRAAAHPQIVALGVNCVDPGLAPGLVACIAAVVAATQDGDAAVLAYPNASEVWDAKLNRWRPGQGGDYDPAVVARECFDAGARVIGGCCRTTPKDIQAMRAALLDGVTAPR